MATLEIQGKTLKWTILFLPISSGLNDAAKSSAEADGITELNDNIVIIKIIRDILKKREMPGWFVPSAKRSD